MLLCKSPLLIIKKPFVARDKAPDHKHHKQGENRKAGKYFHTRPDGLVRVGALFVLSRLDRNIS